MSQYSQSRNGPLNQEGEISLLDILLFVKQSWKMIAVFGVIGFAIALTYLLIAPQQYEAIARIQMAQISAAENKNLKLKGINIEEPNFLIARMSLPTSFTSSTIAECGLDGKQDAAKMLAKSIKLSIPKGTSDLVDLKATASNPERAQQCATAIFEFIKKSQDKEVSPYIIEVKNRLVDYQARLAKEKDSILKADKSGAAIGAVYFSSRDEIHYLLDEIAALKNILISNINGVTRLVAPVYVSGFPISPKKELSLVLGLLIGLFLGLSIALVRRFIFNPPTVLFK